MIRFKKWGRLLLFLAAMPAFPITGWSQTSVPNPILGITPAQGLLFSNLYIGGTYQLYVGVTNSYSFAQDYAQAYNQLFQVAINDPNNLVFYESGFFPSYQAYTNYVAENNPGLATEATNDAIGELQSQEANPTVTFTNVLNFTATNDSFLFVTNDSSVSNYILTPYSMQASVTANVVNGSIVGANVTDGGAGYFTPPPVTITGPGSGATAVATVGGGAVTGITIQNGGSGFDDTTTIQIGPPLSTNLFPGVRPLFGLVCSNLVPGGNYQVQFNPGLGSGWTDLAGGAFNASDVTNLQCFPMTNSAGFYRLRSAP